MRFLLLLLTLALASCTEFHNFVNTGSSEGEFDAAVTYVAIDPNRFEMTNGERRPAAVYAFVGENKLDEDEYHVQGSVSGFGCVTLEGPVGRVFTLKGERPGDCEFVARVGSKEARASVHVSAASE